MQCSNHQSLEQVFVPEVWNVFFSGRMCTYLNRNPRPCTSGMYECVYKCSHASAVREDQCVPIDVALPSAREVNGGGGGGGEGWEESGMGGAH